MALKPVSPFGWLLRIAGALVLIPALLFAALVAFYEADRAASARNSATFAKLAPAARRLAVYDAFVRDIDQHYYDQTFSGMDWPKMRSEWRSKAAKASDWDLYFDVLFQMTQRFPSSHMSVTPPAYTAPKTPSAARAAERALNQARAGSPQPAPFSGDRDVGFQMVQIRRAKGTGFIVGEVWPRSAASRAGVTPGWLIQSFRSQLKGVNGHISAVFLRLKTNQMHTIETTGTASIVEQSDKKSPLEIKNILKSIEVPIDYDFRTGSNDPPFLE